jgi:transcriptional regulator with XRE-family HTH domain
MDKNRERALAKRLGKALAEQRRAVSMTQEALAEKLNCGVEAVSRAERGAIMPTLPRLIETAEALGCPYYPLLGVTSDLPEDLALGMARQLAQVAPKDREFLANLVALLASRLKA